MKIVLMLASICTLFLAGCSDNSLVTDEEYRANKGPAAHAPDYSQVLPQQPSTLDPNRF